MRYVSFVLVPLVVVACAKGEQTQENAAASSTALTDAAVAGTWMGVGMPLGSDSVVTHWTEVCGNGSCVGTNAETSDTVRSTYTIAGDSVIGTAAPYASTGAGGAMVSESWVVHPKGDSVTGTGEVRLADKPDSVVMQFHFRGARQPGM